MPGTALDLTREQFTGGETFERPAVGEPLVKTRGLIQYWHAKRQNARKCELRASVAVLLRSAVERIPQRELRNDVSGVLRRVMAGERLRVTVAGRDAADLVPIEEIPTLDKRRASARPDHERTG